MIACVAMAASAWMIARGDLLAPLGVFGGGTLAWISYRGIKGGIDAVASVGLPADLSADLSAEARSAKVEARSAKIEAPRAKAGRRAWRTRLWGLVKFFTRYGILALAAYVIMARLRLPPLAVFAGASSLVIAVAVEAARGIQWKS